MIFALPPNRPRYPKAGRTGRPSRNALRAHKKAEALFTKNYEHWLLLTQAAMAVSDYITFKMQQPSWFEQMLPVIKVEDETV
jgi:hypothetical protein